MSGKTNEVSSFKEGLSIAILAGGESKRMGADKALRLLGGKPVIAHVIDRLRPLTEHIFIVADDAASYERFGLDVHADRFRVRSSLTGIYSALAASPTERCFIVACDMPFVEPELVRPLAEMPGRHNAVIPVGERGVEPLQALYNRNSMDVMLDRLEKGAYSVRELLQALDALLVPVAELAGSHDCGMSFFNINTPADLESAGRMLEDTACRHENDPRARACSAPLICFVGKKNSGKTSFIEKLVSILTERGMKVAYIKHDAHDFVMDHKGTDTYRIARSGAEKIVISSSEKIAFLAKVDEEKNLAELAALINDSTDIIIAEGYKGAAADKIEISRTERSPSLTCPEEELKAVISDRPDAALRVPVFGLEDVDPVCDFLLESYSIGSGIKPGGER